MRQHQVGEVCLTRLQKQSPQIHFLSGSTPTQDLSSLGAAIKLQGSISLTDCLEQKMKEPSEERQDRVLSYYDSFQ